MLEFRVLGPLEVADGSGPLAARRPEAARAPRAAAHPRRRGALGRPDRRRALGREPPRTATTSLQNFVSQLRKLARRRRARDEAAGLRAARAPSTSRSIARFEQLVAKARRASPEERARLLRDALALWRGPPLADFAYEPFAQGEIQRLEELRLDALEQRLDADLVAGARRGARRRARVARRAHPLRERLRGHLMLALYRSGRQAEALSAYHEGRARARRRARHRAEPRAAAALRVDPAPGGGARRRRARPELDDQLDEIVKAAIGGTARDRARAAARASARSRDGQAALPSPDEVAAYLAECFDYPPRRERDLARVSQYVALMKGVGPLYDELHDLFDRDYEPGPVEREPRDARARTCANAARRRR